MRLHLNLMRHFLIFPISWSKSLIGLPRACRWCSDLIWTGVLFLAEPAGRLSGLGCWGGIRKAQRRPLLQTGRMKWKCFWLRQRNYQRGGGESFPAPNWKRIPFIQEAWFLSGMCARAGVWRLRSAGAACHTQTPVFFFLLHFSRVLVSFKVKSDTKPKD